MIGFIQGETRHQTTLFPEALDDYIVAHEVTNKTDRDQLCRMSKETQAALKETEITVIADNGYYSGVDIKDCQDNGMAVIVPKGDHTIYCDFDVP